jgi:hypothetical protein
VVVKAPVSSLAHALVIAIARLSNDQKYTSYKNGYGLRKPVEDLLKASGVDLSNVGAGRTLTVSATPFGLQNYCV